jgi:hypothetical protein
MHFFFPPVARFLGCVKCAFWGVSEMALTSQDVLFLRLRCPRADCDASHCQSQLFFLFSWCSSPPPLSFKKQRLSRETIPGRDEHYPSFVTNAAVLITVVHNKWSSRHGPPITNEHAFADFRKNRKLFGSRATTVPGIFHFTRVALR